MTKLFTFLTYDAQAEEAANFYVSIFPDSRIDRIVRCGPAGPGPHGSVLTVAFTLMGTEYVALNGGPHFAFSEGVSITVECDTQDEIDHYSERLSDGGQLGACGWLKDKFGVSWQVNPRVLREMLADDDADRAARVLRSMMTMRKIDVAALEAAYRGDAQA